MGASSNRSLFSLIAVLLAIPVAADSLDNDFEEKPWTEIEIQLPSGPPHSPCIVAFDMTR